VYRQIRAPDGGRPGHRYPTLTGRTVSIGSYVTSQCCYLYRVYNCWAISPKETTRNLNFAAGWPQKNTNCQIIDHHGIDWQLTDLGVFLFVETWQAVRDNYS